MVLLFYFCHFCTLLGTGCKAMASAYHLDGLYAVWVFLYSVSVHYDTVSSHLMILAEPVGYFSKQRLEVSQFLVFYRCHGLVDVLHLGSLLIFQWLFSVLLFVVDGFLPGIHHLTLCLDEHLWDCNLFLVVLQGLGWFPILNEYNLGLSEWTSGSVGLRIWGLCCPAQSPHVWHASRF